MAYWRDRMGTCGSRCEFNTIFDPGGGAVVCAGHVWDSVWNDELPSLSIHRAGAGAGAGAGS
ncbi:hypothetical protein ACLOJK_015248 [Asimina triloba]